METPEQGSRVLNKIFENEEYFTTQEEKKFGMQDRNVRKRFSSLD